MANSWNRSLFHRLFHKLAQSVGGFFGESRHEGKRLIVRFLVVQTQKTPKENIRFVEISENLPDRFLALGRKHNADCVILADKPRICKTAQRFTHTGARNAQMSRNIDAFTSSNRRELPSSRSK